MKADTKDYVVGKVMELKEAPSCCPELKEECQKWLDALGTKKEDAETRALLAEIEADIGQIDHIIELFGSDMAKQHFGEEKAAQMLAHAKERKAAGEKYCDCPACTACAAILEVKDQMIA